MSVLFDKLPKLIHGGDYNPDQWLDYPDILEKDIELMKKAHINCATLGVFSWSTYEPQEGEYHFEWLTDIIDRLYENGIYTILATPTGARPAWMDKKYPMIRRHNSEGVLEHHQERHNHCMTSLVFRDKVKDINTRLANAIKGHEGVILWHLSNEYEGACYCDECKKKFQNYLKNRYKDIKTLNHEYWAGFWSKRFSSFDEIDPPYSNGEQSLMGLSLDWKRFTTWNQVDFMKFERDILKEITPDIPFTTNMMSLYQDYDYQVFAKEIDMISWDTYPMFHNDYESLFDTFQEAGFTHSIMRSLIHDKPWMIMEMTPSLVNWRPYNKLKKPNVHRLSALHALANGSDAIQYFQFRKSRGAAEMFHGAVVDHNGKDDTRVFKEVTNVGETLEKLQGIAGTIHKSDVAIIMDWENKWALKTAQGFALKDKKYEKTLLNLYDTLQKMHVPCDIIASTDDFDRYKVIYAPMMFLLKEGAADRLKAFVKKGGTLIGTYMCGYVNENQLAWLNGFPGDGLKDVFGIESEEIDTYWPSDRNSILYNNNHTEVFDYAEILRVNKAKVLGTYESDFYKDSAALTVNTYGKGEAYYIACRTDMYELKDLFSSIFEKQNIELLELPECVEYHVRENDLYEYHFYLNESDNVVMFKPVDGEDVLNDTYANGLITLNEYGVSIIRKAK